MKTPRTRLSRPSVITACITGVIVTAAVGLILVTRRPSNTLSPLGVDATGRAALAKSFDEVLEPNFSVTVMRSGDDVTIIYDAKTNTAASQLGDLASFLKQPYTAFTDQLKPSYELQATVMVTKVALVEKLMSLHATSVGDFLSEYGYTQIKFERQGKLLSSASLASKS